MTPGEKAAWNHLARFKHYGKQRSTFATAAQDFDLLESQLNALRQRMVDTMRDDGMTWEDIGEYLALTAGQARYRYG